MPPTSRYAWENTRNTRTQRDPDNEQQGTVPDGHEEQISSTGDFARLRLAGGFSSANQPSLPLRPAQYEFPNLESEPGEGDALIPTRPNGHAEEETKASPITSAATKGLLELPREIRQQILSYLVDVEDTKTEDMILCLNNRHAVSLSHVSRQFREDVDFIHHQWRRTHRLRDALCRIWSDEDQYAYDALASLAGHGQARHNVPRTPGSNAPEGLWKILVAVDRLRAQRHETKLTVDMLTRTMDMQRGCIRELREENERLKLAAELTHMAPTGMSVTN